MMKVLNQFLAILGVFLITLTSAFATGTGSTSSLSNDNFALKLVVPISFSQIELTFNHNISQNADDNQEFKIVSKTNSLDELGVIKTNINVLDPKKILLTFDKETLPESTYEITVIDLKDENGKNIESGIDGITSFIFPKTFQASVDFSTGGAGITENTGSTISFGDETGILLNSAPSDIVSGANLTGETIVNNIISEAKKNEKLPKTGPEEFLILIFSIILTTLVFILRFKKA